MAFYYIDLSTFLLLFFSFVHIILHFLNSTLKWQIPIKPSIRPLEIYFNKMLQQNARIMLISALNESDETVGQNTT